MKYTPHETKNQQSILEIAQKNQNRILTAMQGYPELAIHMSDIEMQDDIPAIFAFATDDDRAGGACPLDIPLEKRVTIKQIAKKDRPKISKEEKYPQAFREMRAGHITNRTLAAAIDKHLSSRPLILLENEDGSDFFFYGSVRGDEQYSSRKATRMYQASKDLAKIDGTALFITLTYDIKANSEDITEAWPIFRASLRKTLRRARDFGGLSYICVLESTAKGYPHAHAIVKWEGVHFESEKWRDGRLYLKDKDFFTKLKSWQPAEQFKVNVVEGKAVESYITKYISKGIAPSGKSPIPKDKKALKTWRKNSLSYMIPLFLSCRQFHISLKLKATGTKSPPQPSDCASLEQEIEKLEQAAGDEKSCILISILTKMTAHCQAHLWMMLSKQAKSDFEYLEGFHESIDTKLLKNFKSFAYPVGCPGCFITQFLGKNGRLPSFTPDDSVRLYEMRQNDEPQRGFKVNNTASREEIMSFVLNQKGNALLEEEQIFRTERV